MAKGSIIFGGKTWEAFTKNAEKAVKEFGNVFDREMLEHAQELKEELLAAYDEEIEIDKHWDIDDEQAKIFNLHKAKYARNYALLPDRDHDYADSADFNTLRGTNTNIKGYVSFNKQNHTFTVGVAGNDILYLEYGSGDLGEFTADDEARAAANINLKDYNSGPTVHQSNIPGLDGYNYWVYHSSVHFGIPTPNGAPGYRTFKDFQKELGSKFVSSGSKKYSVSAYLQSVYAGKRS